MTRSMRWTVAVVGFIAVAVSILWIRESRRERTRQTESPAAKSLVVLSFGGDFADAQRAAYFEPFEKSAGVAVEEASYNGEYGRIKAAVESGTVLWTVADVESSALVRGTREEIFLPIDYSVVDSSDLVPGAVKPTGVGTDLYSVSLGFNTNAFPSTGPQPHTWVDFWDVKKFPGPRSLKKDPRFTLEIALMADGLPLEDVYANGGLDVERAFRSLDRIKPYVEVWWTTGQQPIDLLSRGEVVMVAAFGARLFNAEHKDGAPVVAVWDQGILDFEFWAVPKGSPDPGLAMRFIDFASKPEQQAILPTRIPLGPVNTKAFSMIAPDLARQLNSHPENMRKQLFFDTEFWAENEASLRERFNAWLEE